MTVEVTCSAIVQSPLTVKCFIRTIAAVHCNQHLHVKTSHVAAEPRYLTLTATVYLQKHKDVT